MSKLRLLILVLGPIPIVGACLAVTDWLRPLDSAQVPRNLIVRRQSATGALAAEVFSPANLTVDHSSSLARRCEQAASGLRDQLGPLCSAIVRPPFVIAGDMNAAELAQWHDRTIGPAARAMAHAYFKIPPSQPITVLLFGTERSYTDFAKKLFNEEGISIYGYYKPARRTLVMNISTGGGTLLHELTHALMAFDCPEVPDWLNEGLASLHEQCCFREDSAGAWIEGMENWRLDGLQRVVRQKRLRSLESLITGDDFRGQLEGVNYAQARYFFLYMQRQGVLRAFYDEYRSNRIQDESGARAVLKMFPGMSWAQLDHAFQAWLMTLGR